MPITPFLHDNTKFDPETKRVMGVAFEMAWVALGLTDKDDHVTGVVAKRIIELAKAGERNPDVLCEQALKGLRSQRTSKQFQSTTNARKQALKVFRSRRTPRQFQSTTSARK
jgi:hypothetical protein